MRFIKERAEIRKVFSIPRHRQRHVRNRLFKIMFLEPRGIPKIRAFTFHEDQLELRLDFVEGKMLSDHFCVIDWREVLTDWREKNFVHGDLSPTNIIVHENEVWFIDWLIELSNYKGTPKYASPEVFCGHHSFESDEYAMKKIFGEKEVLL